jgi:hypothetical protein
MREVRRPLWRCEGDHQARHDDLGQSEDLEQLILREPAGHSGHRRMAVDLLSMEALDWDEGELLDEHSARSGDQPRRSGQPARDRYGRRQPNCRAANRLPARTHTRG